MSNFLFIGKHSCWTISTHWTHWNKHTEDYATKRAMKRKAMQEKSQLPSTKRRRNILKKERAVVQNTSEVLEGISYQSGKFLLWNFHLFVMNLIYIQEFSRKILTFYLGIGHDAVTDNESLPQWYTCWCHGYPCSRCLISEMDKSIATRCVDLS